MRSAVRAVLVALLVLGDVGSATPTHARRLRRDRHAIRGVCSASTLSSSSASASSSSVTGTGTITSPSVIITASSGGSTNTSAVIPSASLEDAIVSPSSSLLPTSSSPSTLTAEAALPQVGPDGRQGHWQIYTTSTWIDDDGSTSSESSSSAAGISASASASSSAISPSNSSTDLSPIASFISSSADDSSSSSTELSVSVSGDAASTTSSTPTAVSSAGNSSSTGTSSSNPDADTGSSGTKRVFAHFMVGIVSTYQQGDWEADINLAKSKGIDGFALNIGVDPYTQAQLDLAYNAADSIGGFDLFLSIDFNWWSPSDSSGVAAMFGRYAGRASQFLVDGKPFISSFIGDGFDWGAVGSDIGKEIYAVPYFQPTAANADSPALGGLFSWCAWAGQPTNTPVQQNLTDDRDKLYLSLTDDASKTYMAPVSHSFSTHFGPEVSYSKNWIFYSEMLWKLRWDQILSLGSQLNYVEIVTWNDYGESHYVGPYNTPHTDDGSSRWAEGFDHVPFLDYAGPYIKAFKAGASAPIVDQEMALFYHRPHLKSAECDSTDNCGSKPTGWDFVDDTIFVGTMTKTGGTVSVTSGSNAPVQRTVQAGADIFSVPMVPGQVSVEFTTNSGGSGSGTSNISVSTDCWNGIYNFNFHATSIYV